MQTTKDKNDCHCPSNAKCKIELEKRLFVVIKEKEELQKKHENVVIELNDLKEYMEKTSIQRKCQSDILEKVFTPGQLKLLMNRTSRVKWSTEDIIPALALRRLSKKAYEFLKNVRGFPLPGLSTLRKWVLDQKKKSLNNEHDYTKIELEESQILCQQTRNKKQILNRNQNFEEKQKVAKNAKIIKQVQCKQAKAGTKNEISKSKMLKINEINQVRSETVKKIDGNEAEKHLTYLKIRVNSEPMEEESAMREEKLKPLMVQGNNNTISKTVTSQKRTCKEDQSENSIKRLKINNLLPVNMELLKLRPVFLLKPQFVIGDSKSISNIQIVKKEECN